jgi:hypothetical protein
MDGHLVVGADRGAGQREFLGPGKRPIPVDVHGPGHDVTIGRYLTPETINLGLTGLAAGLVAGLAWRAAGRVRWGSVPFVLAVLVAARNTGRSDWPRWDSAAAVGAVLVLLAGVGGARLLADATVDWRWMAAGTLFSAAAVWAGVPETGPIVLAGSALTGLAVTATLTRARWAPTAGAGVAAVLGWAALSGAAGRPWAAVGGALCTGVAPWLVLGPLLPAPRWTRDRGPWLLGAHAALAVLAARWIGVNPHAGWHRVALLAAAGLAVAAATRRRA